MLSFVLSDVPSFIPSSEPTPALFQEKVVFTCSPEGIIDLAQPPFETVTAIAFKVGYQVNSLAPQAAYIEDLEREILATAVTGALQCGNVGQAFSEGTNGSRPNVPMNTTGTGDSCEGLVSVCTILETEFQVLVNEDLDPEVAAFLGYVLLRDEMDSGAFVEAIPIIDSFKYLSPLPLLPPIADADPDTMPGTEATERVSVSPWTLGAVTAMCKSP